MADKTPGPSGTPRAPRFETFELAEQALPVEPANAVRSETGEALQPDALRARYETFEDFRTYRAQADAMIADVLHDHPQEQEGICRIIDDAVLLYERPYQYHNAVHMLTTLCFAIDRAVRVRQLCRNDSDIVQKMRNVVTMVAYHDTGNKHAPRPDAIDETEAAEHFLKAAKQAPEDHPLHHYATPAGEVDRNIICAAHLASFFRERFVSYDTIAKDLEQDPPKKYGYIKSMAIRLGLPPYALAALVADDKYGQLMKNADISSSIISDPHKNLGLNFWEDLQRQNSIFVGQTVREYDQGFKNFITGKFANTDVDDQDEVVGARNGIPMLRVVGIDSDSVRDAAMLKNATDTMQETFSRHEAFYNLLFAQFNVATAPDGNKGLISMPLTAVFEQLRRLQQNALGVEAIFLRKKGRPIEEAVAIRDAITALNLAPYIEHMRQNGLSEKCWAQLTEADICRLLGENVRTPPAFATTAAFVKPI